MSDDRRLREGLNVYDGKLTCEPVAAAQGLAYVPVEGVLA
jgi:alanine dehydrogenase